MTSHGLCPVVLSEVGPKDFEPFFEFHSIAGITKACTALAIIRAFGSRDIQQSAQNRILRCLAFLLGFVEVGEAAELTWKEKLLDLLLALPAAGFERLCQRILRESGFIKVEVTGRSGDGGIDGIGILRVQLVSFQVLFQSKKWKGTVGASVVRDFRGAMIGRADKGLIITTGTFSADARREATRDGAPAIDLVDGDYLCDLLKQLRIGVSVQQIEHVAIDEKSFAEI
jgi:hypothetical protein